MNYRSTRGAGPPLTVSEAMLRGLAVDGGLFVPDRFPHHEVEDFDGLETAPAIGARLLAPFFVGDPLADRLEEICRDALDFPLPLIDLEPGTALLELFHGPTAAFKDVGARFLAACFQRLTTPTDGPMSILVATSGDTGGAIASAFHRRPGIDVGILFPEGRVSTRQQHQLTCWGDNVHSFAVHGVFDDCQRLAKEAFADEAWRRAHRLTSANSINIGRLLPQTIYYAVASLTYLRRHGRPARFVVPSGNAGNACAALWARRMGLPIVEVELAANANRPIPDLLQTGDYTPRATVATLANAMDVGAPSNVERILDLFPQLDELRAAASSSATDDPRIREVLVEAYRRWDRVVCPHTATAIDRRWSRPEGDAVIVATAHPAKFESIVEPLIGCEIPLPDGLASLMERPSHYETIPAELAALQDRFPGAPSPSAS